MRPLSHVFPSSMLPWRIAVSSAHVLRELTNSLDYVSKRACYGTRINWQRKCWNCDKVRNGFFVASS